MIMQTHPLPPLQDIACLARHLYEQVDEASAAAVAAPAASCVPAQRMLGLASSACKPNKVLHTHNADKTHCAHTESVHTQPSSLRQIHNIHPHCASTDILHTDQLTQHVHSQCDNVLSSHNVDDFTPLGTLGRGNMGTVILVLSKHSPDFPFALKITHSLATKKQRSHVEREILSSLRHPFLQTLHAHLETVRHSLLLLDFCSGGDLNLLRHRQPEKRFSETAARFYAAEVLVALEHLHKLGIVYRDLKPENILLQESGHIKLTDFDLSLKVGTGRKASAHVSTTPPICSLKQQLEAEADMHLQLQASKQLQASTHVSINPPICSLQQQLEAEAEAHLQLQPSKQSLHCSGFACLRGFTSRNKEGGFRNQKEEETRCASGIGVGLRRTDKEGPKKKGVCSCGTREAAGDRRTRQKSANKGCLSKGNKCVGGREARKMRKSSTIGKVRMPCLLHIKSQKESNAEERSVCVVGTDEYVAPEVLKGDERGFSMDWWSFGILLYEMIYGCTPFKGATTEETLCNILEKEAEFPGMKSPAKNLIAQLLVKNPASRLGTMGAQDIKRHPFFHGLHWESLPHICRPPFLPSPLCLSELEERYSAKLKAKRDAQIEQKLSDIPCKSWLDEVVEGLEAADNSSQNSHTSSSAGFISSSADGADRELHQDDDIDAVFSSAEWSSELDVCMHHARTT